jgi:hypothetical protein
MKKIVAALRGRAAFRFRTNAPTLRVRAAGEAFPPTPAGAVPPMRARTFYTPAARPRHAHLTLLPNP